MEPRVIRLVPKPAPFADALRYYGAAKYHDCLDALRGNESLPAVILTARALLRLAKFGDERLDRAIELLEGTRGRADREGSDALRGELAMLLAASYHRAELPDEAERAFFDARVYLWSTRNAELQSELEYYEGIFAWSVRNLDAASRHARAALNKASLSVHARALELLGAIAASSGNYLGPGRLPRAGARPPRDVQRTRRVGRSAYPLQPFHPRPRTASRPDRRAAGTTHRIASVDRRNGGPAVRGFASRRVVSRAQREPRQGFPSAAGERRSRSDDPLADLCLPRSLDARARNGRGAVRRG